MHCSICHIKTDGRYHHTNYGYVCSLCVDKYTDCRNCGDDGEEPSKDCNSCGGNGYVRVKV